MSTDTLTNYIVAKKTLMNWVQTRLTGVSSAYWTTVRIFEGQGWDRLYHFLPEVQPPSCVIVYTGSKYDKKPRATLSFSVVVVARDFRGKELAQEMGFDKIDHVISLLDHELYNSHALCLVKSDSWIDLWNNKNDGLTAYKVDFEIEDY
jgi:stress-induced morphogen